MPTPTPTPYADPAAASQALKSAFGGGAPLTAAEGQAIRNVSKLVPIAKTTPQAPSEPAVMSSDNITSNVIPANNDRLTKLATKGTTVGPDGVVQYANGSAVPAPPDAMPDSTGYVGANGQKYATAPQTTANDGSDEEKQIYGLIDSMKASLDSSTLGIVNSIHGQFDQLRQDQMAANQTNEKNRAQSLLVGGASRYAPLSAASTMLAQTSYGLRKIADLDAQENTAIAQAQKAQQDGDMQLMHDTLSIVEKKREEKVTEANKLNDQLQAANQKSADARLLASRDEAIAGLVSQGVNKPADIIKAMNGSGWTLNANDVSGVLKSLQPTGAAGDLYKFTNVDVGKLLGAGINAGTIQSLSDYYNGRSDGSDLGHLTSAQESIIHTVLSGKGPAATGAAKPFKFTPTQTSQLLSGNFTQNDIVNMESDVAQHGIEEVVKGMSADQAKLIKRVLGTSDAVGGKLGQEDGTTLDRAKLSEIYGIPDNSDTTGGFLGMGGDTNASQLDALESLVNKYKDYYTDKEILDMIQKQSQ